MDLKLIHVFLTVHKHQSYTEAAHVLGVSQPAVSKSIKKLEASLNKKLFFKAGRNMTCTTAGEQLALECSRGMEIINNAVSTNYNFIAYCPEDLIPISRELPDTVFRLPPDQQEELLTDLRLQKVDLAIDVIDSIDKTFICEPICTEKFKVICRTNHPRISGPNITPLQFSSESHIGYKRKFNGHSIFDVQAHKQVKGELKREVVMEVSSSHSICMIVAQTDYIGIVRESITTKWAERLGLNVMALPKEVELTLQLNLIYHQRFRQHADHKQVREQIKRTVQQICQ